LGLRATGFFSSNNRSARFVASLHIKARAKERSCPHDVEMTEKALEFRDFEVLSGTGSG
jgi:hypothetical protein